MVLIGEKGRGKWEGGERNGRKHEGEGESRKYSHELEDVLTYHLA